MDSIWLARDLDGELHAFEYEPYWRREFGHWASMGESEDPSRKLPGSWFPEIEPGRCVRFERAKP